MTPEEREKRNQYERERYAALTPEQKQKVLDDHAAWKKKRAAQDPEQHAAASKQEIQNRTERYHSDPEFREKIKAYQREAARARRARRKAEAAGVSS
jgi:hypothetical protein